MVRSGQSIEIEADPMQTLHLRQEVATDRWAAATEIRKASGVRAASQSAD
jgi:hypothetical protein